MLRPVLILSVLLLIVGPAVAQPQEKEHTIVLFGARWCAPCMAEYKNLPQLAKAAAPDRIALAWIDRPIGVPTALGPITRVIPVEEARQTAERLGGIGYGLPFSSMNDSEGHVCALWRNPLEPSNLETLRKLCRKSS